MRDLQLEGIESLSKNSWNLPNMDNRRSDQIYVMFMMESPSNDVKFNYEKFENYFNWTMTYRRDSDIYNPYGWISPRNWSQQYSQAEVIEWDKYIISGKVTEKIYVFL